MTIVKKLLWPILGILVLALLWYLFLKPQDYIVRAKTTSITGTVNQTLKSWVNTLQDSSYIEQREGINHLVQRLFTGDSVFLFDWHIEPLTDSTTRIKVDITDQHHSLAARLKIPFTETPLEKRAKRTVMDFLETLKEHQDNIKIAIEGQEELSPTPCACVNVKGPQAAKAKGMMQHYNFLSQVLAANNIQLNGVPFIKVNHWDMEKDALDYDFCFPVLLTDPLPTIQGLTFQAFKGGKGLKAIYNGNYITSDRAWYALLEHAEKNNVSVEKKPIEFFFNNPNMGGDALQWKTEVFLPVRVD